MGRLGGVKEFNLGDCSGPAPGLGVWRGRDDLFSATLAACCLAPAANSAAGRPYPPLPGLPSDWQQLSNDQQLRLCQPPPLAYFRGKSENDQLPPKPNFSCASYLTRVYLAALGVNLPPPCIRQRDINTQPQAAHSDMGINEHRRRPPSHTEDTPHTQPHSPASAPRHSGTQSHTGLHACHKQSQQLAAHTNTPQPIVTSPGCIQSHINIPTHRHVPHSHHNSSWAHNPTISCPAHHTHSQVVFIQPAVGHMDTTNNSHTFHTVAPLPHLHTPLRASLRKRTSRTSACDRAQHSSAIKSKTSPHRGAKWKKGIGMPEAQVWDGRGSFSLGRKTSGLEV